MKISTTLIRNNVMVRVAFADNTRRHYATGVKIEERSQWSNGAIIKHQNAVELNAIIGKKVADVKRAIDLLVAQGYPVTPDSISDALNDKNDMGSFLDYMEERINSRPLRYNTKRNHLIVLEALKRFGRINSFASLTTENIMLFDRFLREEDSTRKQVTIRGYHKCIKPYIAEAVMMRKLRENPYNHFAVQRGSTIIRNPLTEQELNAIYSARLPQTFVKAQDIFIFQAYTGLSYADAMEFDARKHIIERDGHSYISHTRTKTDTPYYTPILPRAESVLLKYGDRLPRLSNQKYNMHLHAIESILGITKSLTSHLARHSFATLMLSHDIPVAVVSRMLGHKDIGVTQIYAKVTSEKIEDATRKLWSDLE